MPPEHAGSIARTLLSSYVGGMTSPQVDGAYPRRVAGTSSNTGSSPRMSADARSRSQQIAAQFSAQIELSMMQSLSQMGSAGESEESGDGADGGGGGDAGIGLDSGMQQMLLMTSMFSNASKSGQTASQLQAQLSALGLGSLGGASAGAGSEAQLAQQLLGVLGGAATGASSSASSTPFNGAVDRGASANAQVVARAAREQGVDPVMAVAMMLVESGGRATAVGDGGTSFGLFQLHEGGMLTAARLSPEQAFDPYTNATVAMKSLAHEWSKGHARRSAGEIAAASQRPADPVGYAAKVNGAMDRARALLASA